MNEKESVCSQVLKEAKVGREDKKGSLHFSAYWPVMKLYVVRFASPAPRRWARVSCCCWGAGAGARGAGAGLGFACGAELEASP